MFSGLVFRGGELMAVPTRGGAMTTIRRKKRRFAFANLLRG
jgi:hypothetical protein